MSDVVLSERPAPHVRLVTLNRPDQLNAISAWAPWGTRLTKQGMWAALEIPAEFAD